MRFKNSLDSLTIRCFKAFSDITLSEFGAFNILIGANDVGKTSLLEALFLLAGMSNLRLPMTVQNHRNFIVQDSQDLSYFFHGLNVNSTVELSAKSMQPNETRLLKIHAKRLGAPYALGGQSGQRVRDGGESKYLPIDGDSAEMSTSNLGSIGLVYDAKLRHVGKKPIQYKAEMTVTSGNFEIKEIEKPKKDGEMILPAQIFRPGNDYFGEAFSDVVVNKMEDDLLELLKHLHPDVSRITTRGNSTFIDIGLEKMIPLNMFGSGFVRAANVLACSILGQQKVLLIDEIENGLHYKGILPFLNALLKLSMTKGVQIFATTHSLAILDGLRNTLKQDLFQSLQPMVKCYSLARDKNGKVRAYDHDYSQFDHCIENGIEIR